jgi:two-component system CheB/CheR fusion protein
MTTQADEAFERLLEYLKRTRGFDFTAYKRASLMRRVAKRLAAVQVEDYGDYVDYLEVHPEEFVSLFNTILINVTSFFRDPVAWESLVKEMGPRILEEKRPDEPIRVWSAGCASGEEAYTLAIILTEALGPERFRERVKIYATDVDEEALAQARLASYGPTLLEPISPELRAKYFQESSGRFVFRGDLRRSVIFGRHDLVQDAPISRLDLLVCRNTLMYFNSETQARILARFHFALGERSLLFLGKSEMLLTHSSLFTPVDPRQRIFTKVTKATLRDRLLVLAQAGDQEAGSQLARHVRLREVAFDVGRVAQIIVDAGATLVLANERARTLFGITSRDIGRSLRELELYNRPVELQPFLDRAFLEQRSVAQADIERRLSSGEVQIFDLQVNPVQDNGGGLLGVSITYEDVTTLRRMKSELERSTQELDTAYEELQSANEELETTNEELQSTVEELETTNEELQSTNEELETMNEELQSTNEELETTNEELRVRTGQVDQSNSFLHSILASLRAGVVVLDRKMNVLIWNTMAQQLWGLRDDEVQGQSFFSLDIGLPADQIRTAIRGCLSGERDHEDAVIQATNRRGKQIQCRVAIAPLLDGDKDRQGVIITTEELGQ